MTLLGGQALLFQSSPGLLNQRLPLGALGPRLAPSTNARLLLKGSACTRDGRRALLLEARARPFERVDDFVSLACDPFSIDEPPHAALLIPDETRISTQFLFLSLPAAAVDLPIPHLCNLLPRLLVLDDAGLPHALGLVVVWFLEHLDFQTASAAIRRGGRRGGRARRRRTAAVVWWGGRRGGVLRQRRGPLVGRGAMGAPMLRDAPLLALDNLRGPRIPVVHTHAHGG
mmetsp:Transcript_33728/g.82912  ORF Transcript_33728/g.82912 Transcript_33728/m.82912 type:complete len:229 (-) Transcript_33728:414-1100(-)